MERLPRSLEKNYNHFKATEFQTWLLFYGIPCLTCYLPSVYLSHFAKLSEAIYFLLGDSITTSELDRTQTLLDDLYKEFGVLYGQGSCGLNVHNVGYHLLSYVKWWGPLWAWSCFLYLNSVLVHTVHGTGDATKHIVKMKGMQGSLADAIQCMPDGKHKAYMQEQ